MGPICKLENELIENFVPDFFDPQQLQLQRLDGALTLLDNQCQCYKTFFPSSLTTKINKVEGWSLETLSSQVLEFEGKARANPIGAPFRCYLLG
jgi:hypothetical protein